MGSPALGVGGHLGALLLFGVLTAVFTWPLVSNLDRVNGAGDPAVMVWSMAWISHAVFTEPATLYGANFFYPTTDALAYTDLLLPSALFAAPFFFATGNALLGFNVVLFLTFVLSGYATFLLAHRLLTRSARVTGRSTLSYRYALPAALFAGALYAYSPYRFGHITQLNSMTTYFLPLMLLFLHRYLEDGRSIRELFFVGLFFALNALSGLYYGVFAALMLAVFYLLWHLVRREVPRLKDFAYGAPIFGVFGMILVLLLGPYLALSGADDHSRSLATVVGGSVIPQALLVSPPESWLLGWTPEALGVTNEAGKPMYELTLYPGLVAAGLAAYGFLRRSRYAGGYSGPLLYASLGLVILIFSFGPQLRLDGLHVPLPYYPLYEFVPGFGSLRVPARMYSIVMLCIAVLAAFGMQTLLQRLRGKKAAAALVALSVVAALEFAPTLPVDRFTNRGPPQLEPAYGYLVENATEDTVIAEIPFASRNDPFRETPRMYRSTHGWWNLVNGYGSYFPEGYDERRRALDDLPAPEGLAALRDLGVDYVIVHPDEYAEDGEDGAAVLRAVKDEPTLERVAGGEDAVIFRVRVR